MLRVKYLILSFYFALSWPIFSQSAVLQPSIFTWEGDFTGNKAVWKADDTLNVYKNIDGVDVTVSIEDPFLVNTTTTNPSDYNDYTKTNTFYGRGNLALQGKFAKSKQPLCLIFTFSKPIYLSDFEVWDIDMIQSALNPINNYQDSVEVIATNGNGRVFMNINPLGTAPTYDIVNQSVKARYIAGVNGDVLHNNPNGAIKISSTTPIDVLKIFFSNGSQDDGASNSQAIKITKFEFAELIGRIEGTVYEDGTNLPLSGSIISLRDEEGNLVMNREGIMMQSLTGADGTYSFPYLPMGVYSVVQVNPNGYESVRDMDGISDNTNHVVLDVNNVISVANDFFEIKATPLAASLFDINAKWLKGTTARLDWSVGSERNNDYFDVSISPDGIDFVSVGQVNSKGNSTQNQSYQMDFENPYNNTSYVQLSQIDFDGSRSVLGVAKLTKSSDMSNSISVSPNPTNGLTTIHSTHTDSENVIFNLCNNIGNVVFEKSVTAANMLNYTMDLSDLPVGIYYLTVKSENGIKTQKIIKQ